MVHISAQYARLGRCGGLQRERRARTARINAPLLLHQTRCQTTALTPHSAAAAAATDYTTPGPCGSQRWERVTLLPKDSGCRANECSAKVLVTYPSKAGAAGCPAGPYPVITLFNGFGARAGFYLYLSEQ